MNTEILTVCDQIGAAALNGMAAGIVLAMFAGCSMRVLGRSNAATRHALWFGTLVLLVLVFPAQWWRERASLGRAATKDGLPEDRVASMALANSELLIERQPGISQTPADVENEEELPSLDLSAAGPNEALAPSSAPTLRVTERLRSLADRIVHSGWWHVDLHSKVPRAASVILVAGWAAVTNIKLTLLLWRLNCLRKLKRTSRPASLELDVLFQRVRAKLGVARRVELRASPMHRSPVVLGFLHPVVLIPFEAGQMADRAAVEQVFSHELAHVRRFDDWANLVQQLIQTVLFFHPAVWWVAKRLALEREIACDDFVLQHGGQARAYALLLVNLAGHQQGRHSMLAPGVSAGRCQLKQRITMILNAQRNTSPRLAKARLGIITAATALVGILILYAGPKLVLADDLISVAADNPADQSLGAPSAAPQPAVRINPQRQQTPPPPALPAIAIDIAEADPPATPPATPGPANVEPGPKFKSSQAPAEELPGPAPREPRKPRAAAAPRAPRMPVDAGPDSNIEARLDRLERMVKALLEQQNTRRGRPELSAKEFGDLDQSMNPKGLGDFRADVKREAAQAAEMEKRAAKQAEKAAKMEEKMRDKGALPEAFQQQFQAQLQALHQQRENLQREMEKLQRQIERIQEQHERIAEKMHRHDDNDEEEDSKESKSKARF